jgi:ATP-binding cassette subfamily F protein 2
MKYDKPLTSFVFYFNLRRYGKDCDIEITIGRRYGLLGQNGCGKTNFLECLANREAGAYTRPPLLNRA